MDKDGNIANEFYIVRDNMEGDIEKIEVPHIKKLEDSHEIQKIFCKYFLCKPPALGTNAANY